MKRLLTLALLMMGFGAALLLSPLQPQLVSAQNAREQVCEGIGSTSAGNTCGTGGTTTINGVLRAVINVLSAVAGTVAVIMAITAGFKYITSGGDTGQITSAKNTLMYALVGVLIVALSQALVRFVLDRIANN